MKTLDTPNCKLQFKDHIMLVTMKQGVEVTLEIMEDSVNKAVELAGFEKYYCIIDLRGEVTDTPESRAYFADNPNNKYRSADAIILNSLPVRLIANFYVKINKPKVPTRIFNTLESASAWIQEMKLKNQK